MDVRTIDALRIRGFLAFLFEREKKKTSIGRKLAAVRAFYKFLAKDGVLAANPAAGFHPQARQNASPHHDGRGDEQFSRPRGRSRPDGDPMMRRDRAILEMLYASGLRVSEFVGLDLRSVNFGDEMLLVRGKGRKERIVSFGSKAKAGAERLSTRARKNFAGGAENRPNGDVSQLQGRAAHPPLRRPHTEAIHARLWSQCEGQPALDAACLCFPPADRRRRPARHSGNAGTQEPCHHTEIHASIHQAAHRCLRQDASKSMKLGVRS